ncbi:MAG: SAM-dependent methyltransferase, partial [Rhodospirillaceae bacterium]
PGASALLSALVVAGLPTDRFLFAGFPPQKAKARKDTMAELVAVPATLVFYEATHRLPESLKTMAEVFGPRPAAVCRELTKMHEEVRRAPLDVLAAHYAQHGAPKGEAVVVIGPPGSGGDEQTGPDLDAMLRAALRHQSVRDAAATVSAATGLKKREVYARALDLSDGEAGDDGSDQP